jgi:hypothetical protein
MIPVLNRRISGILLIEAMIYMAAATMMLGSVMVTVASLMRATSAAAVQGMAFQNVDRFRSQLASDLSACKSWKVVSEEERSHLSIEMKDGLKVEWSIPSVSGLGVVRIADGKRELAQRFMRSGRISFSRFEYEGKPSGVLVDVEFENKQNAVGNVPGGLLSFSAFALQP